MQYLVVVDTNVLVSALLSKHDDASTVPVLKALYEDRFTPLYNNEILSEYNDVLHRAKFHFPAKPFIVSPNELLDIINQ